MSVERLAEGNNASAKAVQDDQGTTTEENDEARDDGEDDTNKHTQ